MSVFQPQAASAFAERQRELKEAAYASSRNEPLGQSRSRGHKLPDQTLQSAFRFGCTSSTSEDAKQLIYPRDDPYDPPDEAVRKQHVRTHGAYDAGEQKSRDYQWGGGVDPLTHRFGFKEREVNEGGVEAALKPGNDTQLKTTIVRKVVEDFKDTVKDGLGAPRTLGFGERGLPDNHTFGRANKHNDWGARECMRGNYSDNQQQPDKDLGKPVRQVPLKDGDENRVFGVPTIRSDVKKPKKQRVTDFQNYGDEAKAVGLMYPSAYADTDIHEEDFAQIMSREALWKLVGSALGISETDFDSAYNLASSYTTDGAVSVETFRRALDELGL